MRSVPRRWLPPVEVRGDDEFRYHYATLSDPTDDLVCLLANRRARSARDRLMRYTVHRDTSKQMDTGVRVNPLLVSMHGQTVSPAAKAPTLSSKLPTDAVLTVVGQELSDTESLSRNLTLVCITSDVYGM